MELTIPVPPFNAPHCMCLQCQVRDIGVPDEILSKSARNVELQIFLNLLDYPTVETLGTDVQVKIDHVVSEQQEPNLPGCNFVSRNR